MRDKVKLLSTGVTKAGAPTGYFKVTTKNKKIKPDKLEKMCFDPRAYDAATGKCGKHVLFKEAKLS